MNLHREARGLARRRRLKTKGEAEEGRVVGDIGRMGKGVLTYDLQTTIVRSRRWPVTSAITGRSSSGWEAYNFKANKALCLRDSRSSGKQRLASEGPVSTSSSGRGLMRDVGTDVGTDIGTDVETVMERPLPYRAVPIAAEGKLSLGHGRTEAARDRRGRRDWKDSGRAD